MEGILYEDDIYYGFEPDESEPEAVCECYVCGETIYSDDDMFVSETMKGDEIVRVCDHCMNSLGHRNRMMVEDLLEGIGVWSYCGNAVEAEESGRDHMAIMRARKREALRRTICTAAHMARGEAASE